MFLFLNPASSIISLGHKFKKGSLADERGCFNLPPSWFQLSIDSAMRVLRLMEILYAITLWILASTYMLN
ncbi:hypothetical protein VNO78_28821 [Psophocarpus tetragonolobus]|uniref:Uncharacterized protein n=1 Tax=Psophocarpus tetragonolobus TaxID=3891 RepID=A0AAN9RTY1_PSOTE